jgi:hypothetical protein
MTEDERDDASTVDTSRSGDVGAVRTGVDPVDDVLASVESLDSRPVEEHVEVFEQAHQALRSALDAPSDPS